MNKMKENYLTWKVKYKIMFWTLISILVIAFVFIIWDILSAIIYALFKYHSISYFSSVFAKVQVAGAILTGISIFAIIVLIIWFKLNELGNLNIQNKKKNEKIKKEMLLIPNNEKITLAKNIGLPLKLMNQHTLLVGTTGSGKTTTLLNIIKELYVKDSNSPIIIIDGKGDDDLINQVKKIDPKSFIWSIDGNQEYNPLSCDNSIILADKIMSLFDFSEQYYQTLINNYLLIMLKILIFKKVDVTFNNLVKYFNPNELSKLNNKEKELEEDFKKISEFEKDKIANMSSKLNIVLKQSEKVLTKNNSLLELVTNNKIILFSLNSLSYPMLASNIGKILIQDLKYLLTIKNQDLKLNLILDEFNVFASDEIINLINKGRGYKLNCLLAFQTNNDLKAQGTNLIDSIYGNCGNVIAHKLNDPNTAEYISSIFGTQQVNKLTKQIDLTNNSSNMASNREVEEFKVHPNDLKSLAIGETYIKVPLPSSKIFWKKIKVEP